MDTEISALNFLEHFLFIFMDNMSIYVFITGLLFSLNGCFLGFRLTKIYAVLANFFIGGTICFMINLVIEDNDIFLLFGLLLAAGMGFLGYKFYKFGIFIVTSSSVFFIIIIFMTIIFKITDYTAVLLTAFIVSLTAAILCVKFVKPALILSMSISYGMLTGAFLSLLVDYSLLAMPFGILISILGIVIQIKINDGLLEKKPVNPNDETTESSHI